MAALDFPTAPTIGQQYPLPPVAGIPTYTWDGEKWTTLPGGVGSAQYVLKVGDTMTGALTLPGNPINPLEAVPKQMLDAAVVLATAAEYRSNLAPTKLLSSGAVWSAAGIVTLTDAATVTPDFSAGFDFLWTVGAVGRTLSNPLNQKPGQKGVFVLNMGVAGATIATWGSAYKFPGGVKPTLTTASGASDAVSYVVISAGVLYCTHMADFK